MKTQSPQIALTVQSVLGALAYHGLSRSHAIALTQCCGPEWKHGLTMAAISKACGVSTAASTQVVDAMENKGLLERKHATDDRRKIRVKPTEKGQELFKRMIEDIKRGIAEES